MANVVKLVDPIIDSVEIYASAARTATPDTVEVRGYRRASGLLVVINVTADPALASVTFKVQGVDLASGGVWDIITSAAVAATGTYVLKIHPHITPASNVAVADIVPPAFRVTATHADGDSMTYSVHAYLVK